MQTAFKLINYAKKSHENTSDTIQASAVRSLSEYDR